MFVTSPFRFNLSSLFRVNLDSVADMLKLKGLEEEQETKPPSKRKKRKRRR